MSEDDEVRKLAESLKSSGLAASMMDGMKKAEEILGYSNKGVGIRVGEAEAPQEPEQKVEKIPEQPKIEENPPENITKPPVEKKENVSQFEDPLFNIAKSNITLKEASEANEEVVANNVLEQENGVEEATEPVVMTNDEIVQNQEKKPEQNQESNLTDFSQSSEEVKKEEITPKGAENQRFSEPKSEKKSELTKEEKEKTDLTKLFNFGNK